MRTTRACEECLILGPGLAVRSLDEVSRPALAEGRLERKTLERTVEA